MSCKSLGSVGSLGNFSHGMNISSSLGAAPVREEFLGLMDSPVTGLFVACPGA